jgi:hypothetical protein
MMDREDLAEIRKCFSEMMGSFRGRQGAPPLSN